MKSPLIAAINKMGTINKFTACCIQGGVGAGGSAIKQVCKEWHEEEGGGRKGGKEEGRGKHVSRATGMDWATQKITLAMWVSNVPK